VKICVRRLSRCLVLCPPRRACSQLLTKDRALRDREAGRGRITVTVLLCQARHAGGAAVTGARGSGEVRRSSRGGRRRER
jgi:hypothetical protein